MDKEEYRKNREAGKRGQGEWTNRQWADEQPDSPYPQNRRIRRYKVSDPKFTKKRAKR